MPLSPKHQQFTGLEAKKKDAEQLRANIETFVDGVMSEKYALADLLNESFTMDMLELLFKRMTSRLRSILFARAKTLELMTLALDPTRSHHTRSIATAFIVVGGAGNSLVPCADDAHRCSCFWDTVFDSLQREADGLFSDTSRQQQRAERRASVAELEELIRVEVSDIEIDGAQTLKQGAMDHAAATAAASSATTRTVRTTSAADSDHDSDNEAESPHHPERPSTPSSERLSMPDKSPRDRSVSSDSSNGIRRSTATSDADCTTSQLPAIDELATFGIFSAESANFAAQILRYFAVRIQKGGCLLFYLSEHPGYVDLLLSNIGHDDIRTLLLHVVYSDHSDAAIDALFSTELLHKMIQTLVTFAPPRTVFERDCIENTFLLLREVIHAPYLTARGVAISAKTIPLDKVTGQDEYVSICGATREMANSALRKYTSRKVRRLIHLLMQNRQKALVQLFVQLMKELTFWSMPQASSGTLPAQVLHRRQSLASQKSLTLLAQGHPRPTCTAMLTHLFELTESVDFTDAATLTATASATGGSNGTRSDSNAVTAGGIDCLNFLCSTHLMRTGKLLQRKKLKNEVQACQVSVNCMMGLRVTSLRAEQHSRSSTATTSVATAAVDTGGFTPNQGTQTVITLDEIDAVERCDWHECGFTVTVKRAKKANETLKHSGLSGGMGLYTELLPKSHHNHHHGHNHRESNVEYETSVEYFAATSVEERNEWIVMLEQVISGDLNELEIFCSDDWRSNVREYRRLRECLITCMERRGHDLMIYLKQVVVLGTRKASGYHLCAVVKCLSAALVNESKRLDRMFVSAQVFDILLTCYRKYPMWNLLLGEITKMLVFCFGDFKSKRSRACPIIEKLLRVDASLLPLLTTAFVSPESSSLAGTDALSNLKMLVEAIRMCERDPRTRSQERVQALVRATPAWMHVLQVTDAAVAKNPLLCITAIPTPPTATRLNGATPSTIHGQRVGGLAPTPAPPAFQEAIIHQISRPSYSTAHGFGSSFLLGDGCAFGYLFKERHNGCEWQKALMVYEYVSYKLWYFYPSEVDESHRIKWKWIVPLGVRTRYTHGHDESRASVGHHGLYITAYDHHQSGGSSASPTREMHFSVTKLEDRDLWKDVLRTAATTIHKLCADYSTLAVKLKKKPDKKTVHHCQDPTCNAPFKLYRRPHSCKRCGKWMCAKCTEQRMAIPEVGLLSPVRHCRACFTAAGGLEADVAPANLFRLAPTRNASMPSMSMATALAHDASESSRGLSSSSSSVDMRNATSRSTAALANAELYELAHGTLSPRALMQLSRRTHRVDSIDSPRNVFPVDEVDNVHKLFLSDEEGESDVTGMAMMSNGIGTMSVRNSHDDEHDISPHASPVSRRSLLHPTEDTRG